MIIKIFKTFVNIFPLVITMYLTICTDLSNDRLITLLIASTLYIVALNFSEITKLTIGSEGIALEKQRLEKLNEEVQVTIDKLNNVIEPILAFNFALLHKNGQIENVTDFDAIVNFLKSSKDILEDMPYDVRKKHYSYIEDGFDNALYSFVNKAESLIGKGKIQGYVNYKGKYSNMDKTRPENQFVNLGGLRQFNNNVEYSNLVDRLEEFVKEFKPEILR